ncbi:MAG: hypothetical protein FWF90_02780 [Promicromonosporaceae bacterium]|nr:hypothetical protein [Promicromonosporaceae bacterium]
MATSAAGIAALALFVLVLGYWVPLRVRQRDQLAAARVEDRFSGGLRVLTVGASGMIPRPVRASLPAPDATAGLLTMAADPVRVPVPATRSAREETEMPQIPARSSRLAMLEERAQRARRRLTITLVLLLATVGTWTAVAVTPLLWPAALAPTALLVMVLALGRAAAAAARRADARWAAERRAAERRALQQRALAAGGPRAPRNRARVTGRAVRGSSAMTQMIPAVKIQVIEEVTAPAPAAEAPVEAPPTGTAWEPRPVPLPTYVTKPPAPRREPRPLTGPTPAVSTGWSTSPSLRAGETPEVVGEATTSWSLGATQDAALGPTATPAPATAHDDPMAVEEPRPRTETLGLPLEQILARRRAAG